MTVLQLLKGKKMMVETDIGVTVEMEIASVEEVKHSEDLEPATRENDWWPASKDWTTYRVKFTNGRSKEFRSIEEITVF